MGEGKPITTADGAVIGPSEVERCLGTIDMFGRIAMDSIRWRTRLAGLLEAIGEIEYRIATDDGYLDGLGDEEYSTLERLVRDSMNLVDKEWYVRTQVAKSVGCAVDKAISTGEFLSIDGWSEGGSE